MANNNLTLLSGKAEAACNAVMGAAVALGGVGISPMSCCAHCSGEIKQVWFTKYIYKHIYILIYIYISTFILTPLISQRFYIVKF